MSKEKTEEQLINACLADVKITASGFDKKYETVNQNMTYEAFVNEKALSGTLIAFSMLNLLEPLNKLQKKLKTEKVIKLNGADLKITPLEDAINLYDTGEVFVGIDIFITNNDVPDYMIQYDKKLNEIGDYYTASVNAVEIKNGHREYQKVSSSTIIAPNRDDCIVNISNDLESVSGFHEVCEALREIVTLEDVKKALPMTALFNAYDIVKSDGGLFGRLSSEIVNTSRNLLYPKILDRLIEQTNKNMQILGDNGFVYMEKSLINDRDDRTSFMILNSDDFRNRKLSFHHHQSSMRPYNGLITIIEKDANDQDAYLKVVPVHHEAILSEELPDLIFSDKTAVLSYDIQKKEIVFYDDKFADLLTVACHNVIAEDKTIAAWSKKKTSKFESDNFDLFIPLNTRKNYEF